MKKHVVIMRSIGCVDVYGANSPEEAMMMAQEIPFGKVQIISPFKPEAAVEIPAAAPAIKTSVPKVPKKKGRRPSTIDNVPPSFLKMYGLYLEKRINIAEMARTCGVSRPTIYKYIRLLKEAGYDTV